MLHDEYEPDVASDCDRRVRCPEHGITHGLLVRVPCCGPTWNAKTSDCPCGGWRGEIHCHCGADAREWEGKGT